MNKAEFRNSFTERLHMLPHGEVEKSLLFYTEIIDDRVEDGMSEEDAVAALGDLNEIVHEIMLTVPLPSLVKEKMKPKHKLRTWEIVLIIIGFPLWFPLLIAFFAVVFSVYVAVWAVIISLYAAVLSLALSGIAGFLGSFLVFSNNIASSILLIASAAICFGLGALGFVGVSNLSILLIGFSKWFLRSIKSLFISTKAKGENVNETT